MKPIDLITRDDARFCPHCPVHFGDVDGYALIICRHPQNNQQQLFYALSMEGHEWCTLKDWQRCPLNEAAAVFLPQETT